MSCKRHGRGVFVRYVEIERSHRTPGRHSGYVMRCSYCRRIVPIGPANDSTPEVADELLAIEVAAGERESVWCSPGFVNGFFDEDDELVMFGRPARAYQFGAFAAHLMGEGEAT